MQSGSLSPILERHTPQHPLPEEIQKMGEDGTVCQFCGVSYLIHREIKKLQDRIEELEGEIEKGKKAQQNEAILTEELKNCKGQHEVLRSEFNQRELIQREMERDMETLSQKFRTVIHERDESVKRNEQLQSVSRSHKKQIQSHMEQLLKQVSQTKAKLSDVKAAIGPFKIEFLSGIDIMRNNILRMISNSNSESDISDRKIQHLEEELRSKSKNEELLQTTIKLMENELKNAAKEKKEVCDAFTAENNSLQMQFISFQSRNTELLQEVAKLQSQLGLSKSDSAQISEALGAKKQELQTAMQKLHKVEKDSEVTIRRLHQEIKILENDIQEFQRGKAKWKEIERNLLSQQDKLRSLVNSTSGESQQMNEQVENLRKELTSLKVERSQMITSHQNQISQLKENFKEKLKKANGDPDTLEETIRFLKQSHKCEMLELESHLKERCAIELGLEKEKHEEELKSYLQHQKEMSENDSSEWKRRAESLHNDLSVSQNHMISLKNEYSQLAEENEKEKKELKYIISELERKIIALTSENDDSSINLRVELKDSKRKLMDSLDEKNQIEQKSLLLAKEIAVLQETVRRECEERFELTEALSHVQEQMKMGRTANSTPVRTPVSAINRVPRQNSLSSQESHSEISTNGFQRHSTRASLDSMTESKNTELSPPRKDIMLSKNITTLVTRNLSNAKSEELAELARRRIAAAIKRK